MNRVARLSHVANFNYIGTVSYMGSSCYHMLTTSFKLPSCLYNGMDRDLYLCKPLGRDGQFIPKALTSLLSALLIEFEGRMKASSKYER